MSDRFCRVRHRAAAAVGLAALLVLGACAAPPVDHTVMPETGPAEPEGTSGDVKPAQMRVAVEMMISAANPYAAQAGSDVLRDGGSAIDAAIAAQMVLTLVVPQSSGIGGGGYMIHWDAEKQQALAYDGRETAPAEAGKDYFHLPGGVPMSRRDAGVSGRSVGVPGLLRMLEDAHRRHGRLPWRRLFEPAMELANRGFAVSPRLHKLVARFKNIKVNAEARKYFLDKRGRALPVGRRMVNRPLARTFANIAEHGADAFYKGRIARRIADVVHRTHFRAGLMTPADLARYRVKVGEPVCTTYRRHRVCGVGPSTSGGTTVAMALGILENFDLKGLKPESVAFAHLFTEALRLAYADRAAYVADPDYARVPLKGLLDPVYLTQRSRLIRPDRASKSAPPGMPAGLAAAFSRDNDAPEPPSTTHFSVADRWGNAVSLTSTVGWGFGSGFMVEGFLLNNQLVAFNWRRGQDGKRSVNHVEGGKRPRSSLSPTMVFGPDGRLRLIIGSPGGRRIIPYVTKAIVAVVDWEMDIQSAISLPNVALSFNGELELEQETWAALNRKELEKLGHRVSVRALTSGLHGIELINDGMIGGADPRREGIVLGR